MLQLFQKLEGDVATKRWSQNSERYFATTLEWNLKQVLAQYNLGSWSHVSLIYGGNFARSDLSVQVSIYTELTPPFFSLLILSIAQAYLCDLRSLAALTRCIEDVSNSTRHSEFKQYLLCKQCIASFQRVFKAFSTTEINVPLKEQV